MSRVTCSIFILYCDQSILMCHPAWCLIRGPGEDVKSYFFELLCSGQGRKCPTPKVPITRYGAETHEFIWRCPGETKDEKAWPVIQEFGVLFAFFILDHPASPKQGVVQLTCMIFADSVCALGFAIESYNTIVLECFHKLYIGLTNILKVLGE